MSDEFSLVAPQIALPSDTVVALLDEGPLPGVSCEEPDMEQIRASEAFFTQNQSEAREVAGVLGMWTGALVLHDLAKEHFEGREDSRRLQRRPEGKNEEK